MFWPRIPCPSPTFTFKPSTIIFHYAFRKSGLLSWSFTHIISPVPSCSCDLEPTRETEVCLLLLVDSPMIGSGSCEPMWILKRKNRGRQPQNTTSVTSRLWKLFRPFRPSFLSFLPLSLYSPFSLPHFLPSPYLQEVTQDFRPMILTCPFWRPWLLQPLDLRSYDLPNRCFDKSVHYTVKGHYYHLKSPFPFHTRSSVSGVTDLPLLTY